MLCSLVRGFATKVITKKQIFFDTSTLTVCGGNGGRGVSAFHMIEPGKIAPSGGNGGKGGNVFIRVNSNLDVLSLPKSVYQAESGLNGKGKCQHGRGGRDLYVDVPIGTLVYKLSDNKEVIDKEQEASLKQQEAKRLFEKQMYERMGDVYEQVKKDEAMLEEKISTTEPTSEVIKELLVDTSYANHLDIFNVASGGKGGEGNYDYYMRSKRQNLRHWGNNSVQHLQATYYKHDEVHNRGVDGERYTLLLQTQKLAEVGLVGYPNAGKSTLLSKLTKTIPKIAAYPFTTLRPLVGYIQYSDGSIISVADIPGIISGAHENRGLGLSFLRHVQRTKVLAYVIDLTDDIRRPDWVYRELQKELLHYDEMLLRKPSIIIANKIDEAGAEEGLKLLKQATTLPVIPISAKNGKNLDSVATMLRQACLLVGDSV